MAALRIRLGSSLTILSIVFGAASASAGTIFTGADCSEWFDGASWDGGVAPTAADGLDGFDQIHSQITPDDRLSRGCAVAGDRLGLLGLALARRPEQ